MIKKRKNSFTLVEILVVITIISIVAGVIIVSTQASRELARDKKRMGDFAAYQTALMQYYSQEKAFPGPDEEGEAACENFCNGAYNDEQCECSNIDCLEGELIEKEFLPSLLKDPLDNDEYYYHYIVTSDRKDFKLAVPLERDQQAMENDGGSKENLYELFSTMGASLAINYYGKTTTIGQPIAYDSTPPLTTPTSTPDPDPDPDPENNIFSDRFGIAYSHFKLQSQTNINSMLTNADVAKIKWLRFDFAWSNLEPTRNNWNLNNLDMAVQKTHEKNIKILGILGASPPWANGDQSWEYPPTDIEAWKNYISTIVSRYKDEVFAWEIGNEQNTDSFWKPEPNARDYVDLVKITIPLIRAIDPDAKIIMGGLAGLDPVFMEECFQEGILDYVDAIAYHPYPETITYMNPAPNEVHMRWIADVFLEELIEKYTTKEIKKWITEVGWTTGTTIGYGVPDRETQAAYMLRSMINYASTSIEKVIIYNLWDGLPVGTSWFDCLFNPEYINTHSCHCLLLTAECNYGLLTDNFLKKSSFYYYKTFLETVGKSEKILNNIATFNCSLPSSLEKHAFEDKDESLVLAVWKSNNQNDSLTITLNSSNYKNPKIINLLSGAENPVTASQNIQGQIIINNLSVGKTPVILKFYRK